MVCQHVPEALQRLGRNASSQTRNIAFEIVANEILSPAHASMVAGSKETVGKTTPWPKSLECIYRHFQSVARLHFKIRYAAMPAFLRMV